MLTAVQERTFADLMAAGMERPTFPRDLPGRLREDLEARLAPVVARLRHGEQLWITKARLTDLHSRCEGLFLANHLGEGEFDYSIPLAQGNLVHRAVEVSVYRPHLTEAELVDQAVRQLRRNDPRFDALVESLEDADAAELEAEAVRQTILFRATFPPLERSWAPSVELPLKAELAGGRVILSTRPDLSVGREDPEQPTLARRLLLELKTGAERPEHDDDLRFYALVATLRFGVPPFRVATVHLENGTWRPQDVTEDLLEAAVRRVGDGYVRAAALIAGEEPRLRAGAWCNWCPRRRICPQSSTRA